MRRWFEFGFDGFPPLGTWQMRSNTKQIRRGEPGEYPPAFVSMPEKQELFSYLNAISSTKDLLAFWVKRHDQGVDPTPGCPAQHIPRAFDFNVVGTPPFFASPTNVFGGIPIFNEDGTFTGNYSSPLFTFGSEPPSENG